MRPPAPADSGRYTSPRRTPEPPASRPAACRPRRTFPRSQRPMFSSERRSLVSRCATSKRRSQRGVGEHERGGHRHAVVRRRNGANDDERRPVMSRQAEAKPGDHRFGGMLDRPARLDRECRSLAQVGAQPLVADDSLDRARPIQRVMPVDDEAVVVVDRDVADGARAGGGHGWQARAHRLHEHEAEDVRSGGEEEGVRGAVALTHLGRRKGAGELDARIVLRPLAQLWSAAPPPPTIVRWHGRSGTSRRASIKTSRPFRGDVAAPTARSLTVEPAARAAPAGG